MTRRVIKGAAIAIATLGLLWTLVLAIQGGFETRILGLRITTNDPLRPLLFAAVALTVVIMTGGAVRFSLRWLAALGRLDDRLLAGILTAGILVFGLVYSSTSASGADSYGYVSQADLWLSGSLKIKQPWVAEAPWPSRHWTFAPLGYRPAGTQEGLWTIVPTYSPGLPLLMAGAKFIGGHCALFAVVPVTGATLVLMTFLIGRRLGSSRAGLIGAWLVASSPVFLYMLPWPMSDVPVAGLWATAFYFLLGRSRTSAAAAGLATALAILIRPNLFFGAIALGLWYALRVWRDGPGRRIEAIRCGALYALGVAPGVIAVALINQHLYGSPFTSGYGGFTDMLAWRHVLPNIRNYLSWIVEAETLVGLVGLAATLLPIRWLWPHVPDRWIFAIIGLFIFGFWAMYCSYLVFDVWWYLRFLLPIWPFMMIGVGAAALAVAQYAKPVLTVVVTSGILWLGVYDRGFEGKWNSFELWNTERKYPSVGRLVREATEPNSVIFSMQHSGSLRYYAGRVTLRYDNLDREWLDRAVAWFGERGVPAYLLVEDWEIPMFERQFGGQQSLALLQSPPRVTYKGSGMVHLFDLAAARERNAPTATFDETYENLRCVPPVPAPTLRLK